MLPLLISVPHGGLRIPREVARHCILKPDDVHEDGDEFAAEIYSIEHSVEAFVTTDIARAIIDLNRAEDDRRADGVVKTHTALSVQVYDPYPSDELIEGLLGDYYRPYHRRLSELGSGGLPLGIDCHTMLAVGPPIGPMAGLERPKICLSNVDGTTCPEPWFAALGDALEEAFEVPVSINDPFKGGFIIRSHSTEMPWVQIELSRGPFLSVGEKKSRVMTALTRFCGLMGF